VLEGQDVVNRIARVERRERDKPVKDVVIKKVTIQKNEAAAPKTGTAAGKKVAFIIAPNNFRDEEYGEPGKILQAAGATVVTASLATGELTGMKGGKVTADLLITAVKADEYDAVAFIGGSGAQVLFGNPEAQRIAAEFAARGKPVAAICIAPTILAKAGVLKGRKATAFPSEKAELTADGAEFTGATVEQDGNIITASGPEAAKEFGDTLVKALTK
jgi:protease I